MPLEYDATLKPKKRQVLPKKILRTKRFHLSPYWVNVSVWVPDVPYNRMPPKVCLTMSHSDQYIRLVFSNMRELTQFTEHLSEWVKSIEDQITHAHSEAIQEHREAWEKVRNKTIGDPIAHADSDQDRDNNGAES